MKKNRPEFLDLAVLSMAFILSRALFFHAGVRFQSYYLGHFEQNIDPLLLKNHLWRSVFFFPVEPPLWNLFLGFVVKYFARHETLAFHSFYILLGFCAALSMRRIMVHLNISRKICFLAALLYAISPSCVLYENYLTYDYPAAAMLVIAAACLCRLLANMSFPNLFAFFGVLSVLALTRSVFHLAWFLVIAAAVTAFYKHLWKKICLAALIPFLAVFFWYTKNYYYFGSFGASTLLGAGLNLVITKSLPEETLDGLISRDKISPINKIFPDLELKEFRPFIPPSPPAGIEVLDREYKSTGAVNLGHRDYITINKIYLRDALTVLRLHPRALLKGLTKSWCVFFIPSDDHAFLSPNADRIKNYQRSFQRVFQGRWVESIPSFKSKSALGRAYYLQWALNMGFFNIIVFLTGLVYAARLIFFGEKNSALKTPRGQLVLFIAFNIVFISIVSTAGSFNENNRYHFVVESFCLILFGLFLNDALT